MKRLKPLPQEEIEEQICIKNQLVELCKLGMKAEAISQNSGVSLDHLTRILNGKTLPVYKAKRKLKEYLSGYEKTVQNIINSTTKTI